MHMIAALAALALQAGLASATVTTTTVLDQYPCYYAAETWTMTRPGDVHTLSLPFPTTSTSTILVYPPFGVHGVAEQSAPSVSITAQSTTVTGHSTIIVDYGCSAVARDDWVAETIYSDPHIPTTTTQWQTTATATTTYTMCTPGATICYG